MFLKHVRPFFNIMLERVNSKRLIHTSPVKHLEILTPPVDETI